MRWILGDFEHFTVLFQELMEEVGVIGLGLEASDSSRL